jgi:hypothetical protein
MGINVHNFVIQTSVFPSTDNLANTATYSIWTSGGILHTGRGGGSQVSHIASAGHPATFYRSEIILSSFITLFFIRSQLPPHVSTMGMTKFYVLPFLSLISPGHDELQRRKWYRCNSWTFLVQMAALCRIQCTTTATTLNSLQPSTCSCCA